jgi:thymidylate synthase (FAD)
MLRHKTMSFQELSQRYADVRDLHVTPCYVEARSQDPKNRQNSIMISDPDIIDKWLKIQKEHWANTIRLYDEAEKLGIAKELRRVLLPEGLTESILEVSAPIRTWIHYCDLRSANGTQKEHMILAMKIRDILCEKLPNIAKAMNWIQ